MELSHFVDDAARDRFAACYAAAMAHWPAHTRTDVETTYGPTATYRTGSGVGLPVVLLHGGNATSASWAPLVPALAVDRPVIAVDTIGDPGGSVQRAPLRGPEDRAAWLDEVLRGLDLDRVHLVGASHGGWMALNQVVHRPQRLVSVTALEPAQALARLRPAAVLRMLAVHAIGTRGAVLSFLTWVRAGRRPSGEMADLVVSATLDHRTRAGPPPRLLTDAQLGAVDRPTLVLLGADSPAQDAQRAARRARLVPRGRAEIIADAGHGLPLDQPDAVTRLLRAFLAEHDAGVLSHPAGRLAAWEDPAMADPVPSGSDVSSGTYKCTKCGYELGVTSTKNLPPCPSCGNGHWDTLTGGDSVHDPYPNRK